MSDDFAMRLQLQKVVAYRELCRSIRHSGRENIFFAGMMFLYLCFVLPQNLAANVFGIQVDRWTVLSILVACELLVGLIKWVRPSAECLLLDAFVVLLFTAYNLIIISADLRAAGRKLNPGFLLLAAYFLYLVYSRFKLYQRISRLFADRPTAEHIAWFDELVNEIRYADPHADDQALDLPTGPQWKVKLLGSTAFFIALRSTTVWILGPEDFDIALDHPEYVTDTHKAILNIHGRPYPVFKISTATWENYRKWRDAQQSGE
jgi:hypothetical protein